MFGLLYVDELRGYLRSKVMFVLFGGLPLLSMLMHYFQPDTEGIPLTQLVAILIASIGGTLAAVVLSTSITSERSRHVYDLFLVRPVNRTALVLAKFFGMLTCLLAAAVISLVLAMAVDSVRLGVPLGRLIRGSVEPFMTASAGMAIACSVGILFGMTISSVAVSAILAVYVGNQITGLIILPTVLIANFPSTIYTLGVGVAIPAILLVVTGALFRRISV